MFRMRIGVMSMVMGMIVVVVVVVVVSVVSMRGRRMPTPQRNRHTIGLTSTGALALA
jgi:heme/copper-type cytochrome/quinol oxidase subunit 2